MAQIIEERRLLTILFADLSGFTALSSKVEPEEVREIANTCFDHLNQAIVRYGGTIHKYEGDLVVALFGHPVAHEDDPERAIKAGLEMLTLLPLINSSLSKKLSRRTDLGLHIGINSGIVFAGEMGSKDKVEYTVMGDVVNYASRLKDIARRGEIIVAESVFRASRYLFDYEALAPASVKGLDEQARIFKPLAMKEKPEPKRGIKGLSSPLVGRDAELESLKKNVRDSAQGEKQVTFILGSPGLGKSRLVEELRSQVHSFDAIAGFKSPVFLEGRCFIEDETLAYGPFLQIIRAIFSIEESDLAEIVKQKIVDKTKSIFRDAYREVAPYLGYLFSIRFTDELDEKVKHLDAQSLKLQIFLGIKNLLNSLTQERPVVVLMEDFHWIDSVSLELLEYLMDSEEHVPVLFLCPSRMEKEKEFWKVKERMIKRHPGACTEILLKPLSQPESSLLADNLLAVPALPRQLQDRILARAEGNPFYLEEIIRSLIDSGLLIFTDGVWKLGTSLDSLNNLTIPDTVHAVIASRLDRLNRETKEILLMASVIGRSFYVRILEHLGRIDSLMLSLHLATLEDYEYVEVFKRKPELEYVFKHPLLQEAAYSSILKKGRRELHRRTGETIERIYQNRLDDFTDLLAHQYSNSDDVEKAMQWLERAGHKAKERYANDEAIRYFGNLVSIIKGERQDAEARLGRCYESLGDIYTLKGENEAAIDCYQELLKICGEDKVSRWQAEKGLAVVYRNQSRYDESLRIVDEALKMFAGESDAELIEQAEIGSLKCSLLFLKGDMKEGLEVGEKAVEIIDELSRRLLDQKAARTLDQKRLDMIKASTLNELGGGCRHIGEYDRAIKLFGRSLKIAQGLGDKSLTSRIIGNLGIVYYNKADHKKAIELCQEHLRTAKEIGFKKGIRSTSGNLGMIYYEIGEVDKGIEYHEISMRTAEEIGDKQGIAATSVNLGNIYRDKGEYKKAGELYERGIEIFTEAGEKQGIAIATGNLGTIFEAMGDFDKAIELYQNGLKISTEIGTKRRVAFGCDALGVVHQTKGEYEKARAFFQEAIKAFEETGDKSGTAMAIADLGGLLVETGELGGAKVHLLRAEAILEEVMDRFVQVSLYRKLGDLAMRDMMPEIEERPGLDKTALKYAELALKIARELMSKLEQADCHYLLGKIYAVAGDFKKADENFVKALKFFEEINNRKALADVYFEYGKMLKKGAGLGIYPNEAAEVYFNKALGLYREMKLSHKISQIQSLC